MEKKVKAALVLYNEMQTHFDSDGNHCLYDTFIKGMQEFLSTFLRDYVIDILSAYNPSYEDMIDNICEVVSASVRKKL